MCNFKSFFLRFFFLPFDLFFLPFYLFTLYFLRFTSQPFFLPFTFLNLITFDLFTFTLPSYLFLHLHLQLYLDLDPFPLPSSSPPSSPFPRSPDPTPSPSHTYTHTRTHAHTTHTRTHTHVHTRALHTYTHHHHHHHHHLRSHFGSRLISRLRALAAGQLMAGRAEGCGTGSARRRRERRLRSMLRHEQAVAMAVAEVTHQSTRGQKSATVIREEEFFEMYDGSRAHNLPPPGSGLAFLWSPGRSGARSGKTGR